VTWREFDVDAGGVRLHVRRFDTGDSASRPLFLLHGLGASGVVWQSFARRLAPAWSAIAPDLRGHGASDHPPSGYDPTTLARDIGALMDALGVAVAPVVGHSLGALAGLALASDAPARVAALTLLDPPLDPERTNPDVPEVYRLRKEPGDALERYLASDGGSPLVARTMAPVFRQAADAAFETYLTAPRGAPWAWAAAPSIQSPVLVVQADPAEGGVLGNEAAQAFVQRLPRGQLVKLPGAGHTVHAAQPKETAEAIVAFLAAAVTLAERA
jgi:pimeloyl-ACP methyl ester carboxylesterase